MSGFTVTMGGVSSAAGFATAGASSRRPIRRPKDSIRTRIPDSRVEICLRISASWVFTLVPGVPVNRDSSAARDSSRSARRVSTAWSRVSSNWAATVSVLDPEDPNKKTKNTTSVTISAPAMIKVVSFILNNAVLTPQGPALPSVFFFRLVLVWVVGIFEAGFSFCFIFCSLSVTSDGSRLSNDEMSTIK